MQNVPNIFQVKNFIFRENFKFIGNLFSIKKKAKGATVKVNSKHRKVIGSFSRDLKTSTNLTLVKPI